MSVRTSADETGFSGRALFAAVLLLLGALMSIVEATLAWSREAYFEPGATLAFSDVDSWAWILLLLGLVQFTAAFGVAFGWGAARWLGIGAAVLTALGQLLFLPARPEWALVAIALSVLVIYALTTMDADA